MLQRGWRPSDKNDFVIASRAREGGRRAEREKERERLREREDLVESGRERDALLL